MASTTLKWDSWKGAQRAVVKATRANKLWHFLGRSTFSGAQIKVSRHSTLELFYNCTTHSRSGHPEIVRWDISFTNFFLIESVFEEMEERKVFPLFPSKVLGAGAALEWVPLFRRGVYKCEQQTNFFNTIKINDILGTDQERRLEAPASLMATIVPVAHKYPEPAPKRAHFRRWEWQKNLWANTESLNRKCDEQNNEKAFQSIPVPLRSQSRLCSWRMEMKNPISYLSSDWKFEESNY